MKPKTLIHTLIVEMETVTFKTKSPTGKFTSKIIHIYKGILDFFPRLDIAKE